MAIFSDDDLHNRDIFKAKIVYTVRAAPSCVFIGARVTGCIQDKRIKFGDGS